MKNKTTHLLLSLAFLFAACAHNPAAGPGPALNIQGILAQYGKWQALPREPYEPTDTNSFITEAGEVIKVRLKTGYSLESAREDIAMRTEEIRRKFERTVEPYFGTVQDNSACIGNSELMKPMLENSLELSKHFQMRANKNFVLSPCGNESSIRLAIVEFLYCKQSKIYYEIRFFSPDSNLKIPKNIVYSCPQ